VRGSPGDTAQIVLRQQQEIIGDVDGSVVVEIPVAPAGEMVLKTIEPVVRTPRSQPNE